MEYQEILDKKGYNSDILEELLMKVSERFSLSEIVIELGESLTFKSNKAAIKKAVTNNGCEDKLELLRDMDNFFLKLCEKLKYENVESYFQEELDDSEFKSYEDDEITLYEFAEGDNAGWKIEIDGVTYYKAKAPDYDVEIEGDTWFTVFYNEENKIEIL
jgi:hypothetical protein